MSNKLVLLAKTALCAVFALSLAFSSYAQAKKPKPAPKKPAVAGPKVTQIDIEGLRELIKAKGKPLLVNFWATWCDPCREEFPDLVKIDAAYKGKIDFVTVSLDDLAEIRTSVPKFLTEVKATMPAYLLKTPDESAAITMIAKDWSGNLPMTVLYAASGEVAYIKMGKVTHEKLTEEIDKALSPATAKIYSVLDFVKIKDGKRDEAMYFYENNWKVYREDALNRGVIHSYELIEASSKDRADFDLILVTRYAGKEKLDNSEKNFEPILKQLRPNGPILKNSLQPADFRQNVFLYNGTSPFVSIK